MLALFDATYAASEEEIASQQKRKKGKGDAAEIVEPIREEKREEVDPKTGKTSKKRSYIYPLVVPGGAFLLEGDPTSDGKNGLWIKLWRDLLWGVLRGVPATRLPFEARAAKEPTSDAADAFAALAGKPDGSVKLASTYFLGAQAENADGVPFTDRVQQQFLLHFWPYVAAVYQPVEVNPRDGKRSFMGSLACTNSDLPSFLSRLEVHRRAEGTAQASWTR